MALISEFSQNKCQVGTNDSRTVYYINFCSSHAKLDSIDSIIISLRSFKIDIKSISDDKLIKLVVDRLSIDNLTWYVNLNTRGIGLILQNIVM